MKIVYSSSGVQQGRETENRDAAIANAASMIDYLCILEGVPTEETPPQPPREVWRMSEKKHSPAFNIAVKEYNAGRWNKAMLKILVKRKPQRLTEDEYQEITGEPYSA